LLPPEEDQEVRRDVAEADHAEVAPHGDQRGPAGQLAEWRDEQRQDEQDQTDEAGGLDREVDVVDAEVVAKRVDDQQRRGDERVDDDEPLRELVVDDPVRSRHRDPSPRRGSPPDRRSR
jgi:hypothetical protein